LSILVRTYSIRGRPRAGASGILGFVPRPKHLPSRESALPESLPPGVPKVDGLRMVLELFAEQLGPGSLMPSERVLAERFDMARTTVRQTLDRLIADGVLFRRHGHGTFVSAPPLIGVDLLSSFTIAMTSRGMEPGASVISAAVEPASPLLAARLEIADGRQVLRLERLRTADGVGVALERIFVSTDRFPGVEELDWTDRSFHTEVADRWGAHVASAENQVSSVLAQESVATTLGIEEGAPCLRVEGRSRAQDSTVIEAGRSIYRGDLYHLIIRAERHER
jgi:GntR family transcriptional regulator